MAVAVARWPGQGKRVVYAMVTSGAAVVRRHRPDIVITNNVRDPWGGRNEADHIATGEATLDAVRDAGNRWVFHNQLADGAEPWGDVRDVWAASSPQSGHRVDITDTFETGVASMVAHSAYIEGFAAPTPTRANSWRACRGRPGRGRVRRSRFSMSWGS